MVDEGHDDLTVLADPHDVRLRPRHRDLEVAQRAARVLRDREHVDRDLGAVQGVGRGHDDVARDGGQHRGVRGHGHGEHAGVPPATLVGRGVRDLEHGRLVGRLHDDPAVVDLGVDAVGHLQVGLQGELAAAGVDVVRQHPDLDPLTRLDGDLVVAATTVAESVGRGLMPTRIVATARCPTQSSTA